MEQLGPNWVCGVTEIPKDVPFYENMVEYILVKKRTQYPADEQPTMDACMRESSAFIMNNVCLNVLQKAHAGHTESRLEIAIR